MKENDKQKARRGTSLDDRFVSEFHQGKSTSAYEYFGCHKMAGSGVHTYVFRVWAPGADAVSLVSDVTGWSKGVPMHRVTDTGVWELQYGAPESLNRRFYKYKILTGDSVQYKADPYAIAAQTGGDTASILRDPFSFPWEDSAWLTYRRSVENGQEGCTGAPLNIYELHLGSWQKGPPGGTRDLTYRQIADRLAPYVKQMGYTHVQLMPVMEHADEYSRTFAVDAPYVPTARYGPPEDFMYFVNKLHVCGVGVILDWSPAGFPKNGHGLFAFDGTPLYEREEELPDTPANRCQFDLRRGEVRSYLISCALYWLRRFHVDGFCISALDRMLPWNPYDGTDPDAVAFLQELNRAVREEFPSALRLTDGSSYPGVTRPIENGGLGFDFCYNRPWTDATGEYMAKDPIYRQFMHDKLTFSLPDADGEKGILALSHDTVSCGRRSLIDRMFGGYEEKFASMRAYLTYMMTFPGKKLAFMGSELSQFREWSPSHELEWFMIGNYPRHREMHFFVKTLNSFYLSQPSLWELDGQPDGFAWLEPNDKGRNVIAYQRFARDGSALTVAVSFSPVSHRPYRLYVPEPGRYQLLFHTEDRAFGGSGIVGDRVLRTKKYKEGKEIRHYLELELPPYAARILKKLPSVKPETKET
ncbi:MAG: 1,4-alpha-glucan branching enzyme [Clostridia bacterium]|nr:1,4-alpha-glucan branching enzyme [Clostridia bacterium]